LWIAFAPTLSTLILILLRVVVTHGSSPARPNAEEVSTCALERDDSVPAGLMIQRLPANRFDSSRALDIVNAEHDSRDRQPHADGASHAAQMSVLDRGSV